MATRSAPRHGQRKSRQPLLERLEDRDVPSGVLLAMARAPVSGQPNRFEQVAAPVESDDGTSATTTSPAPASDSPPDNTRTPTPTRNTTSSNQTLTPASATPDSTAESPPPSKEPDPTPTRDTTSSDQATRTPVSARPATTAAVDDADAAPTPTKNDTTRNTPPADDTRTPTTSKPSPVATSAVAVPTEDRETPPPVPTDPPAAPPADPPKTDATRSDSTVPLAESPARETASPEAARPAAREVLADPMTPAAVPGSTPNLGTATAPPLPVGGEVTEQAGEAGPANAEGVNEMPSAADAPGAGLALATLPFDLVALDRAVENLLNGLQDAGRALDEAVGGVGSAPWLAALAAVVTTYEITRRRRNQAELAADALVAALPEARS